MATLTATYRTHRQTLIDADNGVMALLFGAQFSASSLDLAKGSSVILARMYPNVPHIDRFNLRPDVARARLLDAESHLAKIAIPYALSVHEDYMNQVKSELEAANVPILKNGKNWNAEHMHAILFDTLHVSFPVDTSEFDALRRIRNSMIHQAGLVDNYLKAGVDNLTPDGKAHWLQVVRRPATEVVLEKHVSVGTGEVMLAFSIVRHLSKIIHEALLTTSLIPRNIWVNECVETFKVEYASHIHSGQLLEIRIMKWAKEYYESFNFSWTELKKEATVLGIPSGQLRRRVERKLTPTSPEAISVDP